MRFRQCYQRCPKLTCGTQGSRRSPAFFCTWVTLNKARVLSWHTRLLSSKGRNERVAELVDKFLNAAELPHGSEKPKLTIRSTGFMDITPTEFFVRGTSVWNMIKEYSEMALSLQDLGPRPCITKCIQIERFCLAQASYSEIHRTSGSFGGSKAGTVNLQVIGDISLARAHPPRPGKILAAMCSKQRLVPCMSLAKPPSAILSCRAISRHPFVCVQGCRWRPASRPLSAVTKFYQKPEAAARELSPCDDAENEASASIGHRFVGPAGGYKVELRNGVILRLRFCQ